MNLNELTPEEKKFIIAKRLRDLHATAEHSDMKIDVFQMDNGNALLTVCDKEKNKGLSITLNDDNAEILFNFLRTRYEYKRQLNYIDNREEAIKNSAKPKPEPKQAHKPGTRGMLRGSSRPF